jgi:signal peptidase I
MSRARARKPRKQERGSLLRLILTVAIIAWAIRSFVFAPFSIPSGSMLATLYIGDYLIVEKWPFGFSRYSFPFDFPPFPGRILSHLPERGDVIVFRHPDAGEDLIKRVIGLPGDMVELRDGVVILNGRALARDDARPAQVVVSSNSPCRVVDGATQVIRASGSGRACLYPSYRETLPGGRSYRVIDQVNTSVADNFPAVKVPQGRLFLMGDNRDDSLDSRYSIAEGGVGMVPLDHVVGRAAIVFWSTDGSSSYLKPWTWFTALRASRIGTTFSTERQ